MRRSKASNNSNTSDSGKTASITPFVFNDHLVRVADNDGEIWWIAKDVCTVLGVKEAKDAVARLDEDEKGAIITDTLGGPQKVSVINESGLYSLVFTSRKPEAKAFKKWVTSVVLPSIRKTGAYSVSGENQASDQAGVVAVLGQLTAVLDRILDVLGKPVAASTTRHSNEPTPIPTEANGFRKMNSKFKSKCMNCDGVIGTGDPIMWKARYGAHCAKCSNLSSGSVAK